MQNWIKKFWINLTYRLIDFGTYIRLSKNWPVLIFDYFGFVKEEYLIHMRNGLKFKLKGGSFQRFPLVEVFNNHYFVGETTLKQGDIVVDLGANAGLFSVYVADKAKKVYAVEPISLNYTILLENIKLNKYESKITPLKLAITDKEGIETFDLIDDAPANSLVMKTTRQSVGQERVQTTTLSNLILKNNISKIDFLKMDIEGSEYDVILTTDKAVFEIIDKIAIELHSVEKHFKHEIVEKLRVFGYKVTYQRRTPEQEDMLYTKRIS